MRWALIGLHAVLGVAAVGAGIGFIGDPSGEAVGTSREWLEGSPFPNYLVPGLFLALVIGSTNLASAAALWRSAWWATLLSLGTGLLLLLWLAIQTAIIGYQHWSQLIWVVTFGLVTMLAALLVRRRYRAGYT